MREIRDEKGPQIIQEKGDHRFFRDVATLNRTFGDDAKTVELFRKLDKEQNELAKKCWKYGKDAVINVKTYDLVRKYIGNPVRAWSLVKGSYDRGKADYENTKFG